eukprot:5662724-Prymnesium_polylepis.1
MAFPMAPPTNAGDELTWVGGIPPLSNCSVRSRAMAFLRRVVRARPETAPPVAACEWAVSHISLVLVKLGSHSGAPGGLARRGDHLRRIGAEMSVDGIRLTVCGGVAAPRRGLHR